MAKFRKKPVEVEAFQFLLDARGNPEHWGPVLRGPGDNEPFYIETLETQRFVVTPGDWIITGVKGEHYACRKDIFDLTYEAV